MFMIEVLLVLLSGTECLNAVQVPICQSDRVSSPPLPVLFQKNVTKVIGKVNNVPAYNQNRMICVPARNLKRIQPVNNKITVLKPARLPQNTKKVVPQRPSTSGSMKVLKPTRTELKPNQAKVVVNPMVQVNKGSTMKQPSTKPNPTHQQRSSVVLQKMNVKLNGQVAAVKNQPTQRPTNQNTQVTRHPPQQPQPPQQAPKIIPVVIKPPTNIPAQQPPKTNQPPNPLLNAVPHPTIPPIRLIPLIVNPQLKPPISPVRSIPVHQNVPQFIPMKYLCNMNISPPIAQCAQHRISTPIINLREIPKMIVPQSVVPKIVKNRGIHDSELIKVIEGISLVELRKLNRVVGDIYSIVNNLTAAVSKQKAETEAIKHVLFQRNSGNVVCANNPYNSTNTFQGATTGNQSNNGNPGNVCFRILCESPAGNKTQNTDIPAAQPPVNNLNMPVCSPAHPQKPCIYVVSTRDFPVSYNTGCERFNNLGECIDLIAPTQSQVPTDEKIVMRSTVTMGGNTPNSQAQNIQSSNSISCQPTDTNCLQPQLAEPTPGYLNQTTTNASNQQDTIDALNTENEDLNYLDQQNTNNENYQYTSLDNNDLDDSFNNSGRTRNHFDREEANENESLANDTAVTQNNEQENGNNYNSNMSASNFIGSNDAQAQGTANADSGNRRIQDRQGSDHVYNSVGNNGFVNSSGENDSYNNGYQSDNADFSQNGNSEGFDQQQSNASNVTVGSAYFEEGRPGLTKDYNQTNSDFISRSNSNDYFDGAVNSGTDQSNLYGGSGGSSNSSVGSYADGNYNNTNNSNWFKRESGMSNNQSNLSNSQAFDNNQYALNSENNNDNFNKSGGMQGSNYNGSTRRGYSNDHGRAIDGSNLHETRSSNHNESGNNGQTALQNGFTTSGSSMQGMSNRNGRQEYDNGNNSSMRQSRSFENGNAMSHDQSDGHVSANENKAYNDRSQSGSNESSNGESRWNQNGSNQSSGSYRTSKGEERTSGGYNGSHSSDLNEGQLGKNHSDRNNNCGAEGSSCLSESSNSSGSSGGSSSGSSKASSESSSGASRSSSGASGSNGSSGVSNDKSDTNNANGNSNQHDISGQKDNAETEKGSSSGNSHLVDTSHNSGSNNSSGDLGHHNEGGHKYSNEENGNNESESKATHSHNSGNSNDVHNHGLSDDTDGFKVSKEDKEQNVDAKEHSDLWNSAHGHTKDGLGHHNSQQGFIDAILGSGGFSDKAHWRDLLYEIANNEPLLSDYDIGDSKEKEDLQRLIKKIEISDICSGAVDKKSCLKLYNYLLMSSHSYLSSSFINHLLTQSLSKTQFSEELNKMILRIVLSQQSLKDRFDFGRRSNAMSFDTNYGQSNNNAHFYKTCSLAETELNPDRCTTIMKMSDIVRGGRYNECNYLLKTQINDPSNTADILCSIMGPSRRQSQNSNSGVYLSDILL